MGSRSLRPTAVTNPVLASTVILARIARVVSPTTSAICFDQNPASLEVDKAALDDTAGSATPLLDITKLHREWQT